MMKEWREKMKVLVYLVVAIILSGCNMNEKKEDSRLALIKTINPEPIQIEKSGVSVEDIRKQIENMDEIYDTAVVKGDHNILVAYKVNHLDRFRMKKIEKNLTDHLEKKYKKEKFVLSSDYKIFLEAVRLREDIDSGKINEKQADKRLHEIIRLKKEKT